jgi:thioredoxin reductase
MQHGTPFTLLTDSKVVQADALIIATGAAAKRLKIPGADEETGFWNKGISACAVCDGSSPLFRCAAGGSRSTAAGMGVAIWAGVASQRSCHPTDGCCCFTKSAAEHGSLQSLLG